MTICEFEKIGERVYSETLPNGLAVHVVVKPDFNKSYAFFATDYGGADRRFRYSGQWIDTPAGVAHFLEHKMFDTPDGGNALSVLSANGASPNAFTSSDMTAYHFESTRKFDENLRMLLSFVSVPYFTQESVAKEQGIIGQEIGMVDDSPGYRVYYNALKSLYAYNPIRDSVVGTVDSIAEITDETLYRCHGVFYNPSNMVLCVVGDVSPEAVVNAAKQILAADPGERPQRDYGEQEPLYPLQSRVSVSMEVSAPQFLIGAKASPAQVGSALLRQKLTGSLALKYLIGPSSKFYTGLYSRGLLSDDFEYELIHSAGTATVLIGGESASPDDVMSSLNEAVVEVSRSGVDGVVFDRVKRADYGSRLRALSSFSALCHGLAEGQFGGYCPLDAFEVIESLAVADIQDFITETLQSDKLVLSVVEPKPQ